MITKMSGTHREAGPSTVTMCSICCRVKVETSRPGTRSQLEPCHVRIHSPIQHILRSLVYGVMTVAHCREASIRPHQALIVKCHMTARFLANHHATLLAPTKERLLVTHLLLRNHLYWEWNLLRIISTTRTETYTFNLVKITFQIWHLPPIVNVFPHVWVCNMVWTYWRNWQSFKLLT